jgi:hypothetical protein
MLDSLFGFGQLASLFGLVAGFVLTVRYRKCASDAHPAQPGGTTMSSFPVRSESTADASSFNALDASAEHVGKAVA